jgi:DNA ligase (NAD+)
LGIRHVGDQTAQLLARHFRSLDALADASVDEVEAVDGVGPKIARSVVEFFASAENRALVERLRQAGLRLEENGGSREHLPLVGLTFVVTGRLEGYSRLQIEERIRELGGDIGDSVTKKTSYVVLGVDAGSKAERAKKLGTPTIDEAAFEALIAERATTVGSSAGNTTAE